MFSAINRLILARTYMRLRRQLNKNIAFENESESKLKKIEI